MFCIKQIPRQHWGIPQIGEKFMLCGGVKSQPGVKNQEPTSIKQKAKS